MSEAEVGGMLGNITSRGDVNATKLAAQLASLVTRVVTSEQAVGQHAHAMDVNFVLFSGYLVFLMQAGFAMLTTGAVRSKNTKNVLLKNVLDACVGSLAYFLFGYALASGDEGAGKGNDFVGWGHFALASSGGRVFNDYSKFFFQWAFAATAATIVSGSVAERTSFYAYLAYAFFLTAFVYPIASHWVWGGGWLSKLFGVGMIDFAGSAVVHMLGGFSGLVGAVVVGPRLGRFDSEGKVVPIPGHSATLVTLGTFLLWFSFYGFNPGSTLGISGTQCDTAARCAVMTSLAAGAGGATTLLIIRIRDRVFDLFAVLNGILAGLVSIAASCAFVEGWAAVLIGAVGSACYIATTMLLIMFQIDDPLEAFPVHGACGLWGVVAGALFNQQMLQDKAGYSQNYYGMLYGGGWRLLAANMLGAIAIAAWAMGLIGVLFFCMKKGGILRISPEEEIIGNDVSKHGGAAYPIDNSLATKSMLPGLVGVKYFGPFEE